MIGIPELLFPKSGSAGEVVALIGSGGKTTLLWLLAEAFREQRILVGATTKIWQPQAGQYDAFLPPEDAGALQEASPGITLAGVFLEREGKVGALPPELCAHLFPRFDKSFLEADGSRGLPFKGWARHEPVVPKVADMTVAVLPVPPAGCTATEDCVHRLSLFLAISGAREGEVLHPRHLASAIAHPKGLLAKARGRIALVFNQVESPEAEATARNIFDLLPASCRKRLWAAVVCSARHNRGYILWQNPRPGAGAGPS